MKTLYHLYFSDEEGGGQKGLKNLKELILIRFLDSVRKGPSILTLPPRPAPSKHLDALGCVPTPHGIWFCLGWEAGDSDTMSNSEGSCGGCIRICELTTI